MKIHLIPRGNSRVRAEKKTLPLTLIYSPEFLLVSTGGFSLAGLAAGRGEAPRLRVVAERRVEQPELAGVLLHLS